MVQYISWLVGFIEQMMDFTKTFDNKFLSWKNVYFSWNVNVWRIVMKDFTNLTWWLSSRRWEPSWINPNFYTKGNTGIFSRWLSSPLSYLRKSTECEGFEIILLIFDTIKWMRLPETNITWNLICLWSNSFQNYFPHTLFDDCNNLRIECLRYLKVIPWYLDCSINILYLEVPLEDQFLRRSKLCLVLLGFPILVQMTCIVLYFQAPLNPLDNGSR